MGPFSALIREHGKFAALIFIYCRITFFGKDGRKISWGGGGGGRVQVPRGALFGKALGSTVFIRLSAQLRISAHLE